jgi:hypothetical protein
MAFFVRCDRCHKEAVTKDETGMLPDQWMSFWITANSPAQSYILCPQCISELKRWLQPLPEGGRGDS